MDRDLQLGDPAGEDALDVLLPQPEPVGMAGGEVADVEPGTAEPRDLRHLPLGKEPIGDAALVEDLDGARLQTARARARQVLVGAPLDDGDVDARQRQLARQHQPGRTASGDHHRVLGHRLTMVHRASRTLGLMPTISINRADQSARPGIKHQLRTGRAANGNHAPDALRTH